MTKRFALLFLLVLASCPLAARATTTPDQIASAPRSYNGQHVEVSGRVTRLRVQRLPNGTTYVRFFLCATRCVRAMFFGASAITEGQTITVHGTYYGLKDKSGYPVYHAIEVDAGSL